MAKEQSLPGEAPEGLRLFTDVVTESDEEVLVGELENLDWDGIGKFKRFGQVVKRREIDFIRGYGRGNRKIGDERPLPEFLKGIRGSCAEIVGIDVESFQQVIAAKYAVEAAIAWHVDSTKAFGGTICGLSLCSECTMHFGKRVGKSKYMVSCKIPLPRRSLLVMQGPSRWDFAHHIPPVKKLRYSVTLRTLK